MSTTTSSTNATPIPTTDVIPDGALVVGQRDGVGAYGIYLEMIEFTSDRQFTRHCRILYCERMVMTFERAKDRKNARWIGRKTKSLDEAKMQADRFVTRLGKGDRIVVMRGRPLLVEFKATDIDNMESGEVPWAKHVGKFAVDYQVGKLGKDDPIEFESVVQDMAKVYDVDAAAIIEAVKPVSASTTSMALRARSHIAPF